MERIKVSENSVGVVQIKVLYRNNRNAIIQCRCPLCGGIFQMQRSHFYRGSNGCKCSAPTDKRLYQIWANMKTRCNNPKSSSPRYFYRGIRVCDEWSSNYKSFEKWAYDNGYSDNLTIDRINNDKGYEPSNCRWATPTQQVRNRSITLKMQYKGVTKTLAEWCNEIGVSYKTATSYYYAHDRDMDALSIWYENKAKELSKLQSI